MANPADKIHAIQRARERYGVTVTVADLRAMETQCEDPKTRLALTDGKSVHLVLHAPSGKALKAVYAVLEKLIVTFIAPEHGLRPKNPNFGKRRPKLKGRCGGRRKRQPRPAKHYE